VKICFVTAEFPPLQGGVGDHTAHLARGLAGLGPEVHILTVEKVRYAETSEAPATAPYHLHPTVKSWGWGCWRSIVRFARRERPDVLHIQYQAAAYDLHPAINLFPWWLRRAWPGDDRPRLTVTYHDLRVPYLFPKAGPLRRWVVLALARWSDATIATNAEDEASLRQCAFRSLLRRVPLGSNVEPQLPPGYDRQEWRAGLGVGPETFLLSHFGFLNDSKGVETLVRALDRLRERGDNLRLLMIGGRTGDSDPTNVAYAAGIEALIAELGLAEQVIWTGYVTPAEVSAHLKAADLCVMPYRDGLSFRRTTLIAALRHGLPVLSTYPAVPLPELAEGQNVALVPPGDVEALAQRIAALADDRDALSRLAAGAEELGRAFDWNVIAEKTLGVYHSLKER
jgi:glycosyltransferase involved in cell wall biosynthesis